MKISKAQTQENKSRIIATAAQLFRERGFAEVSVAELMHSAGLTHGGFYNHFDSKRQLEEEACALSFGEALRPLSRIGELDSGRERRAAFASYVESYLKPRASDAAAPRCPFVVFGSDMPRQINQAPARIIGMDRIMPMVRKPAKNPSCASGSRKDSAMIRQMP